MAMVECPKCGELTDGASGYCSLCGGNLNEKAPASAASGRAMYKAGGDAVRLDPPAVWMYVLSCLFPVLQWILMGVYVSKNQQDDAFKLFIKPIVAQIVLAVIVIIIFACTRTPIVTER